MNSKKLVSREEGNLYIVFYGIIMVLKMIISFCKLNNLQLFSSQLPICASYLENLVKEDDLTGLVLAGVSTWRG